MGDRTVENALIKAVKRGVGVQVCGENESGEYDSAFAKLARAGIRISYYSSSTGFYVHGKVVEADYGTDHREDLHRLGGFPAPRSTRTASWG